MLKSNTTRLAITVTALLSSLWLLNHQLRFLPLKDGLISEGDIRHATDNSIVRPDGNSREHDAAATHIPIVYSGFTPSEPSLHSSTQVSAAPSKSAAPSDIEGFHEMQADKVVVVGTTVDEDASWVRDELPMYRHLIVGQGFALTNVHRWQHAIYSVENQSAPLHTTKNKGREGNVYLTYLVEHYDKLPATIAFDHPHREGFPKAWHTDAEDYSNVKALQSLNIDFVQKSGYANLRCVATPGCPDEIQPFRPWDDQNRYPEHAYGQVWIDIFNNTDVPKIVGAACCAQFAVSRNQVLKRPKEDYVRFHQYLMETSIDDAVIGRVYEYMWHIIFGKDPV